MNAIIKRMLLTFAGAFLCCAALDAQVSIQADQQEVRSVIRQIERSSQYRFFFSSELPGLDRRVTLHLKDVPLEEALDKLLDGIPVDYTVRDGSQVVLSERKGPAEQPPVPGDKSLRGRVTDEAGEPLVGVVVTVKGGRIADGRSTDLNGYYSFPDVSPEDVLIFQYMGFARQEIRVGRRRTLNVTMYESSEMLDDVVVIGYGTLEKRELTSSVTSLKAKDFIGGNTASPVQAIMGKVTGLDIHSSAGNDPNSSVSLQLRGVNSLLADQGPLVVIDGIPGGNINILQKEDIVSIDVLKDASAGAIYGTRASGGVILVTTRMGQEGKVGVSYSSELTTETILRRAHVLTSDQWRELGKEDMGGDTDWFQEITRTPFTQRQMISMSGGSKTFSAYASAYWKTAQGMAIGSDRQEVGARFNFSYTTLGGHLELSGRVNYVNLRSNYTDSGIFRDALTLNPTIPVYNPNDESGYNILTGNDEYNPVANVNLKEDSSQNDRLQAALSAKANIARGLTSTLTVGALQDVDSNGYWESALHRESRENNRDGYARQSWKRYTGTNVEWVTNYNLLKGRHSLKAAAGYSFQQTGAKLEFSGSNADFSNDGSKYYNMGDGKYLAEGRASMKSYKSPRERLIAVFARVNYSFDDRYLVSASARYEGSSKFGDNNKWGLFPALSAAWRISQESFLRSVPWINDIRIRAGVGVTGNQGFDPGVTTRMYRSDTDPYYVDGRWITVYGLSKNVNYDLQWETKTEYNVGVDWDLFDHRFSGKVDVYKRYVDKLIYDINVAQPPAVYPTTTMNVGSMQNNGIEFELSAVPVRTSALSWRSTLRGSHNVTVLGKLWRDDIFYDTVSFPSPGSPGTAVRLEPGQRVGQFYVWKYAGIDENGNWLLYDRDDNIIPATEKKQEDKRYTGNALPDVVLSWDNSISWKNFDFNVFFRSWIGHDVFNMTEMYYGLPNAINKNVLQSAYTRNAHIVGEKELCDYFIEDGSFLKLDAVSIGYTLELGRLVRSIRLSLSGRNLFCLTGYKGIDPEVNTTRLTPGFEGLYLYPDTRVYTFGLQVNF